MSGFSAFFGQPELIQRDRGYPALQFAHNSCQYTPFFAAKLVVNCSTQPRGTLRNLSIPLSSFVGTAGTYSTTLQFPQNYDLFLAMSDATGPTAGGITPIIKVGAPQAGASCNTADPGKQVSKISLIHCRLTPATSLRCRLHFFCRLPVAAVRVRTHILAGCLSPHSTGLGTHFASSRDFPFTNYGQAVQPITIFVSYLRYALGNLVDIVDL